MLLHQLPDRAAPALRRPEIEARAGLPRQKDLGLALGLHRRVGGQQVAYCWGSNEGGKLGDGTTDDRLTPTPVAGAM